MTTFMNKILHIIPAAGKATRIGGIPKFLLPIGHDNFLIKFHVENLLENFVDLRYSVNGFVQLPICES